MIYKEEDDTAALTSPEVPVKPSTQYIDPRIQNPQRLTDVGNYHSALVNTKYVDLRSLISHIGGGSWTVDYFYNVVDTDDEPVAHDNGLGGAYQQFTRIVGLELKVQTPIEPDGNFDEENGEFIPEGTATLYAGLKPNVNNLFVADIGDGRLAELTVNTVRPLTILKDSAYSITYTVTRYLDDKGIESLLNKTIATYYFDLDDLQSGGNGLLTKDQVVNLGYLEEQRDNLVQYHLNSYYDHDVETLLVPTMGKVYDMFIPGVIRDIIPLDSLTGFPVNRELNCHSDVTLKMRTLWDVLISNNKGMMNLTWKGKDVRSVQTFEPLPALISILYSGVNEVIYPRKGYGETTDVHVYPAEGDVVVRERMYKVHYLGGYVLSPFFYESDYINMSVFEMLVMDYLDDKVIHVPTLISFIEEVHTTWSEEQRFYLIPILLVLISVSLQQKSVD